jgi:L-ascorbate metabolism protein UlaG (beta-lactamase superfamily)
MLTSLTVAGAGVFAVDYLIGSRRLKGHPASDYFDGRRFRNLSEGEIAELAFTRKQMARRMVDGKKPEWEHRACVPTVPARRVEGDMIVTTHINHSTVLIQTQGLNILTDPIWAARPSPLPFVGPKRFQAPGVRLADLPPIDIVLLSHNHYDHMDIATLKYLHEHHSPVILTPLGNSAYLSRNGIQGATDMNWGDAIDLTDSVRVVCVPAQHNTERWITDANRTLWGGFVIETPRGNIYFAGDTGYGPFLKRIQNAYPDGFVLGLLPIGAYAPRWYCKPVHTDPDEAFAIKRELKVEHALAIHYGTFQLGDEPQDEPVERLERLRKKYKDDSFVAVPNGKALTVK